MDGVDKDVLMNVLPKPFADKMLWILQKRLHPGMPDSGIAFTFPMSGGGGSSHMVKLAEHLKPEQEKVFSGRDGYGMMEAERSLIMAIVNQGYSEEVMNAARPMGAAGGTVFHSRQLASGEAVKFWGICVQPEREVVLILASGENKKATMKAIGQSCGMHTEAGGLVLSVPVDGVAG